MNPNGVAGPELGDLGPLVFLNELRQQRVLHENFLDLLSYTVEPSLRLEGPALDPGIRAGCTAEFRFQSKALDRVRSLTAAARESALDQAVRAHRSGPARFLVKNAAHYRPVSAASPGPPSST
jgi:hypothetical protein